MFRAHSRRHRSISARLPSVAVSRAFSSVSRLLCTRLVTRVASCGRNNDSPCLSSTALRKGEVSYNSNSEGANPKKRLPFAYNPLSVVRVPGKTGKYDEVEWPDDDGKQYELGKSIIAIHWGSDAFFMILPSGALVNFKTFAYTKSGVTWNMQEALPKAFVRQLVGFQSELRFAEEKFAALRSSWDKKDQLTRATASSRRIEKAAETWSQVHIPESQKLDILRRAELFERNDAAAPDLH